MEIIKLLMCDRMPKKDLFRASEIASLLSIALDEIFEWESEFPQIWSIKSADNIRYYDFNSLIFFASIKHRIHEKNQSIPMVLKAIAEADSFGAKKAQYSGRGSTLESIASAKGSPTKVEEELLLDSSSLLVEEEEGFDERVQEIYQQYAHSIDEQSIAVELEHMGEMIKDALAEEQRRELQSYKRAELERTREMLMQKKKSLDELLGALDTFGSGTFLRI